MRFSPSELMTVGDIEELKKRVKKRRIVGYIYMFILITICLICIVFWR